MSWDILSLAKKCGDMRNGLCLLQEWHLLVNVTITCEYMYCSAHTHFACKDTCTGSLVTNKLKSVKWNSICTCHFPLQKNIRMRRRAGKHWMITACITEWLTYVGTRVSLAVNVVSVHTGMSVATVGNCMDDDRHWIVKQNDECTRTSVNSPLNFITGFKNAQQCC